MTLFICYDRIDAGYANHLYDRLSAYFGRDQTFMDTERLPAGSIWQQELLERVIDCSGFILIIGPDWGNQVLPKLHDPGNWVRKEITTALENEKPVFPVRMGGATIRWWNDLPEDIRPAFTGRHHTELKSGPAWTACLNHFCNDLQGATGLVGPSSFSILTDNTAFHSAGRCLGGQKSMPGGNFQVRSQAVLDIQNLLQFSTYLILADKIRVGHYEQDRVREETGSAIDRLKALGVPAALIHHQSIRKSEFKQSCIDAAQTFEKEIESLSLIVGKNIGLAPDHVRGLERRNTRMHKLISGHSVDLQYEQETNLDTYRSASAPYYALLAHAPLLERLQRLFESQGGWSDSKTYHIAILYRFYLNEVLADRHNTLYSPAVARAELFGFIDSALVKYMLSAGTRSVARELRQTLCSIPIAALVHKTGGNSERVIENALQLRNKAERLRQEIGRLAKTLHSDSIDDIAKVVEMLKKISEDLLPVRNRSIQTIAVDLYPTLSKQLSLDDGVNAEMPLEHSSRKRSESILVTHPFAPSRESQVVSTEEIKLLVDAHVDKLRG